MQHRFIAFADLDAQDDEIEATLYWSNTMGWVGPDDATLFTMGEAAGMSPPLGSRVVAVPVEASFGQGG